MKINWKLVIILAVAIFLRFYQLGINPPALTWDETAWGYNAYSLGIDVRDEFGRFLPHDYLESFGDFKPPVYAYLDIIPVKVFGLNAFATRFPSAFFGSLTILITYFLVKRLFPKKSPNLALFSSLFLAISPWHIMLSRAAFEANIATFLVLTGVWLFLCGVQEKKWYLPFSAVFFALSFYTFNTPRIVAPLLVLILAIGFHKKLLLYKKQTILAVIIGILLLLPTVKFLLSPQADLRFREVNIFTDISVIKRTNQEIVNNDNTKWAKVLYNRRLAYGIKFIKHYLDHFNPNYLFISGDINPKFSTQDVGQLYIWDLPFLLIGIIVLLKEKQGAWWLIPLWILVGIIPAATARETPHALRTEITLPVWQILIAIGCASVLAYITEKKKSLKKISFAMIFILLFANFLYFYHGYTTHYAKDFSDQWQYGYKDSIDYVGKVQSQYQRIYVTTFLGRPYIYYLFYLKIPPQTFRNDSLIKRDAFGFVSVQRVGKYYFTDDENNTAIPKKDTLFINNLQNVPVNAKILKTFYFLDGTTSLVAYTL